MKYNDDLDDKVAYHLYDDKLTEANLVSLIDEALKQNGVKFGFNKDKVRAQVSEHHALRGKSKQETSLLSTHIANQIRDGIVKFKFYVKDEKKFDDAMLKLDKMRQEVDDYKSVIRNGITTGQSKASKVVKEQEQEQEQEQKQETKTEPRRKWTMKSNPGRDKTQPKPQAHSAPATLGRARVPTEFQKAAEESKPQTRERRTGLESKSPPAPQKKQ